MLVLKSNDFYANCDAEGCTQCFDTDVRDEATARRVLAQHGWRVVDDGDGPTAATLCIEHRDSFKPKPDMVNSPPHYTFGKFEVIDVLEDWQLDFCLANAVKYIARHAHKGNPLQDLLKARWYLERAIAKLEPRAEVRAESKHVVHFREKPTDFVICGHRFAQGEPYFDSPNWSDVDCPGCREKKP